MRRNKSLVIWDICYPVVAYLILFNVAFYLLGSFLEVTNNNYMLLQIVVEAVCLPLVLYFYRKSPFVKQDHANRAGLLLGIVVAAAGAITAPILNTSLTPKSTTLPIVALSILIPFLLYVK